MFTTLFIHELQNYLHSLRFHVSFVIVVLVFIVGSIAFVSSFFFFFSNYAKQRQNEQTNLTEQASSITSVAIQRRNFIVSPRGNGIVADCKENFLPNEITYSAYNVFGFSVRHNTFNPLLSRTESMSWSFIVTMFLSFITLLFAFDAISGEKEDRTLALVFSNPVSRRTILGSKLASIITVVGLMQLIGIIISMLILTISGKVNIDGGYLIETAGFIFISLLLITIFAVFGLFSSVVTRYSNISLLISLCFWLVVAVVIPNTSVFWAKKLFAIPSSFQVEAEIREDRKDLEDKGAEGRWSSNGGDPFYPRHELRANHQTDIMNSEKRFNDANFLRMFRQFENTRTFTVISPIAQFDYINEAFLGGGYLRFRKNWDDIHIFQAQFLQWFKDIHANDSESPHWYNPFEALSSSRKPVEVDQIPQYQEQLTPFVRRILFVTPYLITMFVTIAVIFGACFYFFVRYDVR
jgi:ABC-type transport system involved in multi-copper enzyme maturation permease subunit